MKYLTIDESGVIRRFTADNVDVVRAWAGRNGFVFTSIERVDAPGRWDVFRPVTADKAKSRQGKPAPGKACARCGCVEPPWVARLDSFGVCQACRDIRNREFSPGGMRIRHTGHGFW